MQYAFVLGRVYTLSLAELLSVLEQNGQPFEIVALSKEVLILETQNQLLTEPLQARLGGVIKILKIIDRLPKKDNESVSTALQHYFVPSKLKEDFLKTAKGKLQIGLSLYLLEPLENLFGEPKRLGMNIKRPLQEAGLSVRIVLPEFNSLQLNSVVVTGNHLLEKGAEICVIAGKTEIFVAKTLRVQDFEDYGRRDYQRPIRDLQMGMIPPKVAQSMLGLAGLGPGSAVLDPFCGYGTFLQEGALMGYKMIGTDISRSAISGSEKNTEWFRNRYKIPKGKIHLEVSDARSVSVVTKQLAEIGAITQVDAVVTEGTLGPAYGKLPTEEEMNKNFSDLQDLYSDVFTELSNVLAVGKKVVFCLPAYKISRDSYHYFPALDFILEKGYSVQAILDQKLLAKYPFLHTSPKGGVVYDRKDQVVAREIIVLVRT